MSNQPRGIRNNNPGNIEWGDPWQGLVPQGKRSDNRFAQFQSPAYGIRALARTLITYYDRHGIYTIRMAINRWAPPVENNTDAYVMQVAKAVGVGPNDKINFHDYHILKPMVEAIIRHENGKGPLSSPNTWYDDPTIEKGLSLAGIEKPIKEVSHVPVTKETAGAAAAGTVGVAQVAEVLPEVSQAITSADSHISSGSIVRMAVGLVTIAIAIFIAWSQVKKHRSGAL